MRSGRAEGGASGDGLGGAANPRASTKSAARGSAGRLAPWLTVEDVAELLSVSKRTVYDLVAAGKLPARRFTAGVGRKLITRFDPRDIDAFREACARPVRR